MKTFLIIGSTGYVGRHLIEALQTRYPEGVIFGLSLHGEPYAKGWRSLEGDLLHPDLPNLLGEIQPDVIFHAMGIDRMAPLKRQLDVLVEGTRYLLQSVLDIQLGARVVITGSAAEYGPSDEPVSEETLPQPMSEYGIAKLAQTQVAQYFAKKFNLPVMVGRIFNIYGETPKGLVIASLASQIARQEMSNLSYPRIKAYNLASARDFIHIQDAARAMLALAESGQSGEVYNIGTGQSVTVRAVLDQMLSFSRLKEAEIVPQGEQYYDLSQSNVEKIHAQTDWRPEVNLSTGLKRELDYWRQHVSLMAGQI